MTDASLRPLRVAIADDDRDLRDVVGVVLQMRGMDMVGEAGDARGLLAAVGRGEIDAVILDVGMDGDPMGVARALTAAQPRPLVVLLSGLPEDELEAQASAVGADAWMTKGRSLTELPDLLLGLVDDRHRRGAAADPTPEGSGVDLDVLLSLLVHELQTPITVIDGLAVLLAQTPGDDIGPERLAQITETISRNASRLARVTNAVALWRSLTARRLQLRLAEIDVGALVEDRSLSLDPAGDRIALSATGSTTARVDVDRLATVVDHLLENAITYSKGPVHASVVGDESTVSVVVADSGPGVAAEAVPRLFASFDRLDRTGRGLGLGLANSRGVCRAHGGDLTAEATPGGGLTLRAALPR